MQLEYEYAKIIAYGEEAIIYRYGRRPVGGRDRNLRAISDGDAMPHILENREDAGAQGKQQKIREKRHARRARMAFRRIVAANLFRSPPPILLTLTYAENFADIPAARGHYNAFAKSLRDQFGAQIRYVVVPEFQSRGAIHFHALIWGLPESVVKTERSSRLLAKLWGKGFVDAVATDGDIKLAGYFGKYFQETFEDPRFSGKKAYITSKNAKRPTIIKDAILGAYMQGHTSPDLSTYVLAEAKEYDTMWLGRCLYQKYLTLENYGS